MVHKTKCKKRIRSLLLCLCMALSCLSVSVFAESGTTTVDEAKWGTSKDDLTGSGTLAEAIAAAAEADSTIKYICLNKSWTATGTDETYYAIEGTEVTFDLNGKTVSGSLALRASSGSITFTDSVGGGQWENTEDSSSAVIVNNATATFTGGSYKGSDAVYVVSSSGVAVIKGGTFTGTGTRSYAILNSGTLTIEGGVFNGGYGVASGDSQTTTITGGDFSGCTSQSVAYWGDTLDLSGYPTTATTGTTPLTDLTVNNRTGAAVTIGTSIKLPVGYGFYKSDDADKTIVTTLAASTTYAIKREPPEAKWGTSKDDLTGSGTLAEAIAAAATTGSTIKYICLNKSWTATGDEIHYSHYSIVGDGITFDLNGKTVSGPLLLRAESGSVTFTDTVGGGKWENTYVGGYAVFVGNAEVTFTGGTYKGGDAVYLSRSNSIVVIEGGTFWSSDKYAVSIEDENAQLTIEGGSFTGGEWGSVAANGTVTIKSGTFAAGNMGHIAYLGGTLDLTGYPTTATIGTTLLTDLTVSNWTGAAVTVGTNIKLPDGYDFYKVGDTSKVTVTELAANTQYAVKPADIVSVDITWTSMEFTYTGGAWNPETHSYADGAWSTSGGTVTVKNTGNVTVTASFAYVTERTDISGSFTKPSFALDEAASDTTKLTLSGKPSGDLENVQIGSITVTIAQVKQGLKTENGDTYYYVDDVKQTGFQTVNGNRYYFGADGKMIRNDFVDTESGFCYMDADGVMVISRFYGIGGNTYLFDENGTAVVNQLVAREDGTYYFDGEGWMVRNACVMLGDLGYYFDENGRSTNGIFEVEGTWFEFDGNGGYEIKDYGGYEGGEEGDVDYGGDPME